MATEIEVIEVQERPALNGGVDLSFRLSAIPSPDWRTAFDRSSVHYEGLGTLDYLNINPPIICDDVVNWRVPMVNKDQASGYVQQRLDQANANAPMPDIMGIEEPSFAGGQWHAVDVTGSNSWPEKTMCAQIEPNEAWRTVNRWVSAGERRCNRCSFLAEQAGLPSQFQVRQAERQWRITR